MYSLDKFYGPPLKTYANELYIWSSGLTAKKWQLKVHFLQINRICTFGLMNKTPPIYTVDGVDTIIQISRVLIL